jgi:rare lipoprotein A
LPVLFCGVLLGAPLLLTRLTSAPASSTRVDASVATAELAARTASPRASRSEASPRPLALPVEDTETTTTSTTSAPTTTTTARPRPRLVTTTTTRPKPKPTTTTTAPPPRPIHSQTGGASWYSAGATDCAHRTIPLGTLITVTNLANGKSTVCRVTTRGPFTAGRVVDLSRTVFGKIASTSSGVIDVRIDW